MKRLALPLVLIPVLTILIVAGAFYMALPVFPDWEVWGSLIFFLVMFEVLIVVMDRYVRQLPKDH